ncbi:MAG: aspartate dehydrogenase domain-containing protein [Candidatus Omnitrophota bacterium]
MVKIGIVGLGSIGSYLAGEIVKRYKKKVYLAGVCERDAGRVEALRRSLKKNIRTFTISQLCKKCDLVIEAAGTAAAGDVAEQAVKYGKDVMIMSVGGLLNKPKLIKKIEKKKIRLYVPSGAIAGLDALKAARMDRIDKVTLVTKKPIAGLSGANFIRKNKINLAKIKKEMKIFEGTAEEAVKGFPKNINVAAILSLAGIGAKKTRVCIIASRKLSRNTHTIEIEGNFGKIISCTENVPSEQNPKTSKLAMLSALATLDSILSNIKLGT